MVNTTNEWIFERTGIRERHIVEGDEVTSGMAAKASREALARVNIARFANTSAASIPIVLCDAVAQGRVRQGDTLVFAAFGGGMTWARLRWSGPRPVLRDTRPTGE